MTVEADTRPVTATCKGCHAHRPEPLTTLWAATPLGLTGVLCHQACATAALGLLAAETGGQCDYITPPPLRLPGKGTRKDGELS